ncbi:MAG: SDR family NAD(P)-dependent oxidoreductase, partial [Fimbriimonas ginsengisoli]|nr:SDR family NAD(P)-dependent oxidoreductase [Fimbriimonas ginsengisoli]
QMVEANFLGAVAWLNQAAIRFQNTRQGTIVGVGSVAGDRGRRGQPVYNATKAALATYLEALRNRLSRYGVKVVTVKPGPTQTEMTASLGLKAVPTAEATARRILAKAGRTGERYLSPVHWVVFTILRNVPSPIFRRLKL